jgi:putative acetyltransferase
VRIPVPFPLDLMTTVFEPKVFFTPLATVTIRVASPFDLRALCNLYSSAFPEEHLLPLIHDLQGLVPSDVLSLVAVHSTEALIVGSVYFTVCTVVDDTDDDDSKYENTEDDDTTLGRQRVALLGPLCVHPTHHHQGIGSALVKYGIEQLQQQCAQIKELLVLGSPKYYGRFGFHQETSIATPYPLPSGWASAWQSMDLNQLDKEEVQEKHQQLSRRLIVPSPWQHEKLWT